MSERPRPRRRAKRARTGAPGGRNQEGVAPDVFRLLFENNPLPMFLVDRKTLRFLEVNEAAVEKYGYDRDEFLRMSIKDIRPPEDVPRLLAEISKPWKGLRRAGQWRHRLKDGRTIEVEVTAHAMRLGRREAILAVLQDETERNRTEAELRNALSLHSATLDSTADGILVVDRQGRMVSFNRKFVEMWRIPEDIVASRDDQRALSFVLDQLKDPQGFLAKVRELYARTEAESFDVLEFKDGRRFERYSQPQRVGSVSVGRVWSFRDVTERRRTEEERDRLLREALAARAEAEAAARAKDEFLTVVSHELRTPMTAMLGWAWLLRRRGLDEAERARGIEVIERNMKLQAQIIEDLLDVSSIVTGKLRLETAPVDLEIVLRAAAEIVRPAADAKSIRLSVAAVDPSASTVQGDPDRLQQVVWNLLSNAVKFTPEGGSVEIRLARDGGRAQVTVSDTGLGISPDFLPFVFDRFRQAESATRRRYRGLGLGLALVKHLVELHGGTVRAESAGEGRGATFTLTLPMAARPSGTPPPQPSPRRIGSIEGGKRG